MSCPRKYWVKAINHEEYSTSNKCLYIKVHKIHTVFDWIIHVVVNLVCSVNTHVTVDAEIFISHGRPSRSWRPTWLCLHPPTTWEPCWRNSTPSCPWSRKICYPHSLHNRHQYETLQIRSMCYLLERKKTIYLFWLSIEWYKDEWMNEWMNEWSNYLINHSFNLWLSTEVTEMPSTR